MKGRLRVGNAVVTSFFGSGFKQSHISTLWLLLQSAVGWLGQGPLIPIPYIPNI